MQETNFVHTQRTRPKRVAARLGRSTAPGAGRALPKVRTGFEDAHCFSKVRILENPDDSFEDAQAFTRCARKTAHLRGTERRVRLPWASVSGGPLADAG